MTQEQGGGPDSAERGYVEQWQRLWDTTVATLTAAVRLDHPQRGPADFADFLASALGAVAGNVGSTERITAGRPGSWESDLLAQLVNGTVGYDSSPQELAQRRTIPVVVRLNVAQFVSESRADASAVQRGVMLPDLDEALQPIYRTDADESKANPAPAADADASTWEAYEAAADERAERHQDAEDDLRRRYTEAFEAYAARFTAAVRDAAQDIQGLTVPVEVQADTDPDASWFNGGDTINPDEWDDDKLAWQLWEAARQRVGLPTLDERPAGDGK